MVEFNQHRHASRIRKAGAGPWWTILTARAPAWDRAKVCRAREIRPQQFFSLLAQSVLKACYRVLPGATTALLRMGSPPLSPLFPTSTSMAKYKLEYIWLDGYKPVQNLRGKTQVKEFASFPKLEELPLWGFDGSSTQQAPGGSSDCVLKPVAVYPDSTRKNGVLVMCEVYNADGTPHVTNARATILDDPDTWFGFEQEYFLYQDGRPLGFPEGGYPAPQGPYYCGAGFSNVGSIARQIVEEHLDLCLDAGINHEGINAEVASGQWEFQIFGKGSKKAADDVWMARYLLVRLCEKYDVDVEFHCKPIRGVYNTPLDWNGSGMHSNFSTKFMREVGGKEYFEKLMAAFSKNMSEHVAVYGPDNHFRLTGLHETQSIDKFTYGVADRGASIRVPHSFVKSGYKGYLEDRRPNSAANPYEVASRILKTIAEVPAK
jgi:glutamine synthetase